MKIKDLAAKMSSVALKLRYLELDLKWTLKMAFLPLSQASQERVEWETLLHYRQKANTTFALSSRI